MNRSIGALLVCLAAASPLLADVSITESSTIRTHNGHVAVGQKTGDKKAHSSKGFYVSPNATGSQALIDSSGLKYFINTNITFSTSSSASAAMSEASYTHAVSASTMNGGTTSSTLNDMFDGYNTLCLSVNNTVATCETGNANFIIYNKNGSATTECPMPTSGVNRQVVFPVQNMNVSGQNVQVSRKVFVPDNDSFARWLNYFKNTSATPVTITAVIANNLGSDSNTTIISSSSGNAAAEVTDTWVTTFQNYSGTTSSDPRIAHVLQGAAAPVPLAGINFANGDDNPFWGYTMTLQPGETKIIMNFVSGQPSKAAANAKAAVLAGVPDNYDQCMTDLEDQQVANFVTTAPAIAEVPTATPMTLTILALMLALGALVALRFNS